MDWAENIKFGFLSDAVRREVQVVWESKHTMPMVNMSSSPRVMYTHTKGGCKHGRNGKVKYTIMVTRYNSLCCDAWFLSPLFENVRKVRQIKISLRS
jgi:hypothetical protein